MPKKLEHCVKKVKAKNKKIKTKVNPYAVCSKSTGYKRGKKGKWIKIKKKR